MTDQHTNEGWVDQDGSAVDPADVPKAKAMAAERKDALAALDAEFLGDHFVLIPVRVS